VVWVHGGPFCSHSFAAAPRLQWLASLGYVVVLPHFEGSTGFGLRHMDAVRGAGCGKADYAGVLAAGRYARTLEAPAGYAVDASRGVAAAGPYSWGGYLSLLAATRGDGVFSCAAAARAERGARNAPTSSPGARRGARRSRRRPSATGPCSSGTRRSDTTTISCSAAGS